MPSGTCILCGCTDKHACPGGCSWINTEHTICSAHSAAEVVKAGRTLHASNVKITIGGVPFEPVSSFAYSPRKAVDGSLCWNRPRHGAVQFAKVVSGVYELVHYHQGWSAQWKPYKGRKKIITFHKPEGVAKDACEQHRLMEIANRMLESSGADNLVTHDRPGQATVFRKARHG